GLNGAGKSTLLRIMAGVDKDFSGEARAQPGTPILAPGKNDKEMSFKISRFGGTILDTRFIV
ncbi:TPA: hypothetical protein ACSIQZ_002754, partial [Acinetobacter baumannii]